MKTLPPDFATLPGKAPGSTRFILVRHGETDWNREKRFQGHIDIPLNSHGILQAGLIRAYFDQLETGGGKPLYTHCISSDLDRAQTTARTIHSNRAPDIELKPSMRERHYGHLSGLTGDEMQGKSPTEFASLRSRVPDALIEGGESLRQFNDRVLSAFQNICLNHQNQTILLVAHGGVLDCIYRHCANEPLEKQRDWQLPNCALNVIDIDMEGETHVRLWAYLGHLHKQLSSQNVDEVDGRVA